MPRSQFTFPYWTLPAHPLNCFWLSLFLREFLPKLKQWPPIWLLLDLRRMIQLSQIYISWIPQLSHVMGPQLLTFAVVVSHLTQWRWYTVLHPLSIRYNDGHSLQLFKHSRILTSHILHQALSRLYQPTGRNGHFFKEQTFYSPNWHN